MDTMQPQVGRAIHTICSTVLALPHCNPCDGLVRCGQMGQAPDAELPSAKGGKGQQQRHER